MKPRRILPVAAAAAVLAGCLSVEDTTGVRCLTRAPEIVAQQGDTVRTNSSLRYIELQAGTGEAAQVCKTATIHYVAAVRGGSVYDSVYKPLTNSGAEGASLTYVIGLAQIRPSGLDIGVHGMREGGRRRLIVPPELGFGAVDVYDRNPSDPNAKLLVPANSTLLIDVELEDADLTKP
jgi:peptidylprolyl isomerase